MDKYTTSTLNLQGISNNFSYWKNYVLSLVNTTTYQDQQFLLQVAYRVCIVLICYFDYAYISNEISNRLGITGTLLVVVSAPFVFAISWACVATLNELLRKMPIERIFKFDFTLSEGKNIFAQLVLTVAVWSLAMVSSYQGMQISSLKNVAIIEAPSKQDIIIAKESLKAKETYYNDLIAKENEELEILAATKIKNMNYENIKVRTAAATKNKEMYEVSKQKDLDYWKSEIAKAEKEYKNDLLASQKENKERKQEATQNTGFAAGLLQGLASFFKFCYELFSGRSRKTGIVPSDESNPYPTQNGGGTMAERNENGTERNENGTERNNGIERNEKRLNKFNIRTKYDNIIEVYEKKYQGISELMWEHFKGNIQQKDIYSVINIGSTQVSKIYKDSFKPYFELLEPFEPDKNSLEFDLRNGTQRDVPINNGGAGR